MTHVRISAGQKRGEGKAAHGWIEEATTDACIDPGIDGEGEAKGQADVEQLLGRLAGGGGIDLAVCIVV